MPLPRTEVSAATVGSEIVVLGGFTIDRGASTRVDAYSPGAEHAGGGFPTCPSASITRWPSARAGSCTSSAATPSTVRRSAPSSCSSEGAGASLPRMPFPRAAAGAGGRRREDRRRRRRHDGRPTAGAQRARLRPPHAALGGRQGADSARAPRRDVARRDGLRRRRPDRRARHEPPAVRVVPAGREELAAAGAGARPARGHGRGRAQRARRVGRRRGARGTIAEVLAYRVADRRWVQPRRPPHAAHGVGVAAFGGRVYVIGGGPEPGLTVSTANEALRRVR